MQNILNAQYIANIAYIANVDIAGTRRTPHHLRDETQCSRQQIWSEHNGSEDVEGQRADMNGV